MTTATTQDRRRLFRSVLAQAQMERPHGAYAGVYGFRGEGGEHVYIGSTDGLEQRLNRHLLVSTWVQFACSGAVVWYASLGEARVAEMIAIGERQPLFNIAGTRPGARRRLVDYLVACDRLDLLAPAVKLG